MTGPTEQEQRTAQDAWFEYRNAYQPGNNSRELRVAYKAFLAGWAAAHGTADLESVQR